jgi:phage-related protein
MPTSYNWPNIQLPSGLEEPLEDPTIRTTFESGIVQTRARYTRMRGTWILTWANLRGAHYTTLRNFYKQMMGGALSFNWTHPLEGTTYEVRFKGTFSPRYNIKGFRNISCTLEQV